MKSKRRRRKARRNPGIPLMGHPIKATLATWLLSGLVLGSLVSTAAPDSPVRGYALAGQLALMIGAYVVTKK